MLLSGVRSPPTSDWTLQLVGIEPRWVPCSRYVPEIPKAKHATIATRINVAVRTDCRRAVSTVVLRNCYVQAPRCTTRARCLPAAR